MGCFEITVPIHSWGMALRVVVYRKRVFHGGLPSLLISDSWVLRSQVCYG
jgi:hypothetical protein